MTTLSGKVVWITGGGSGIGAATALALARAGAQVTISGRREEALRRTADSAGVEGLSVEVLRTDVADADAVARGGETLLAREGRLDILVNSAGTNVPMRHFRDLSAVDWRKVVDVNLSGAFYCVTAVLPTMRAQGDGLIVNVASWVGRYTALLAGPAYNSSKHAVVAFTETLNMEEGRNGIRATCLCPAEVDTEVLDSRPVPPPPEERAKMLKAEDVAGLIRVAAELPRHVCLNEMVVSPIANRFYRQ